MSDPIILDVVDRLQLENMQLRLENMQLRLMRTQSEHKARLQEMELLIERLGGEFSTVLQAMGEKYGFDPGTTQMEPGTGRIIPRSPLVE